MIGKEEGELIVVSGDGSGEVRADKEGKNATHRFHLGLFKILDLLDERPDHRAKIVDLALEDVDIMLQRGQYGCMSR